MKYFCSFRRSTKTPDGNLPVGWQPGNEHHAMGRNEIPAKLRALAAGHDLPTLRFAAVSSVVAPMALAAFRAAAVLRAIVAGSAPEGLWQGASPRHLRAALVPPKGEADDAPQDRDPRVADQVIQKAGWSDHDRNISG
jgi:hypothetical protein